MTGTQATFDLRKKATRKKIGPELARRMIAYLAGHDRWVTRTEFGQRLGLTDRQCRLGREAAHGRILAGSQGYKLLRYATPGEIEEAAGHWISMIKACQEQYSQLMRRAHKALHDKKER